ncbi:MAG: Gfo/Idh/MocA family protein, partial [Methanosarcinaceae archaeon]
MMMKKLRIALVGVGNIMQRRHIPAIQASKLFDVVGIIDKNDSHISQYRKKFGYENHGNISDIKKIKWLKDVEAVIIATPPLTHGMVIERFLREGKHVLVEKPFVVDLDHGRGLLDLAKEKGLILAVNQNFQYTNSFIKVEKLLKEERIGPIRSFNCIQYTNDTRDLPKWAEDLPLGLFYDESPHFFYLLRKFGGRSLKIHDVQYVPSSLERVTPHILNISMTAGEIPVQIYCNFESPICEWYFNVITDNYFISVDMFRDILVM